MAVQDSAARPTIFGHLPDGTPIREVTLRSAAGATATIMEWGAVVRDLMVPVNGKLQRVVLGYGVLDDYLRHSPHFGAIAGRYANRIAGGHFHLDGKAYQLPLNQAGKHSLHGGGDGFGKRPWTIVHHDAASVTLALVSPDGDHGYPGTLTVTCRYTLSEPATLRVELSATTDAPTIINLCHHSYFNLDGSADILDHALEVRANLMTPVDEDLIPTGEVVSVKASPFDFRKARPIRLLNADGTRHWYDHNFILRRDRREASPMPGRELGLAATLRAPANGLAMEVWTTEPALQVYDGFKTATPVNGLDGKPYGPASGICLEPQHVPDSPNLPHFPSTVLRPGELYGQVTEYRFA
ncbi:MAG: galactose mutarotase [Hyphomicrobiales bacterium]|jgi:aldose 1-epimerase|nr:galactose mutarotase [Hyphomicrobiales bacterium]